LFPAAGVMSLTGGGLHYHHHHHHHRDTTFTKIFVGGLPYHTSDQTLRSYFEPFGDITEAVVITDRQTGKSRGYGFVSVLQGAWLGSRVVSVLDSGAVGPRFKSQPRRCRVTVLGKLFTPIVPLFTKQRNWQQPLLRVVGITAAHAESNGSLPPRL